MKNWICIFLLFFASMTYAQDTLPLYEVIPNSKPADNLEKSETAADGITRVSEVSVPQLIVFRPANPNGTAVIICPGGGYRILAITHEGYDVARELNKWGVTAFVLKYRLPSDRTMLDRSIGPLQDAERAIQLVREHAREWGINPKKIGIMGFSAGGHLAASLSTRYRESLIENPKKTSFRPDFSVLVYPVISFTDSLTHMGSRNNLIGSNPSESRIKKYSNEFNIDKKTPPAFLIHAKDDKTVPIGNAYAYYNALQQLKIPAALKVYETGGHGFGMYNKKEAHNWMGELKAWMQQQKFLPNTL